MQHREYSELRKRIQSFRDFPNKAIDSQKLAEAGFFFAGDDSDSCLCFWCGVCLHRWEPTDDPWEEHQKVDGKYGCDFLKYRGAVPDNLCETKPTSSGDITQYHPPSRPRNPPVIHNIHNFHESKPEYNREFDRDRHYSSMPKSRFYESTDKNKQYLHLPTSQTPVTQTSNNSSTSTAGGHHSSISPHLGNQQNNMSSNTTGGYMSPLSNHLPHGGFGGEITYSSTTAPIQSQQNNMSSSATGGYIPPLSNHLPYGGFGGYRPPLSNHLPHGGFGGEITYSSTTAPIQSQQNNMSSSATGGYIPPLPNHLPHGGFGGYRPPLSNHLPHGGFGGEITYSSTTAPILSQQNNMSSSATGGYIPPLPNHLPHGGFGGYRPPLSNHLPHGGFGGEITYSSTTAPILSQQNNMSSNTTGGYMSPLSNPQGATSRTPTIPPKFPPLDNSQNLTPQMPHRTQVDHLSQPLSGLAISNPTKQTTFTPPTSASARALNQFPSQPNQFAPSNQPHLPHGGFGGDITYSSTTAPILSQQNNMSSKATGGYIPPLSNHLPRGGFGGEITYSSTTAPIQSQQNNMSSSTTGGYIPPLSNHLPHSGFGGEITYSSTTAPIQSQQNNMSSNTTGGYMPPLPKPTGFSGPSNGHTDSSQWHPGMPLMKCSYVPANEPSTWNPGQILPMPSSFDPKSS